MPGIAGILSEPDAPAQAGVVARMSAALSADAPHSRGTLALPDLGLDLGWVTHRGSFCDGMPVWDASREIGLVFFGEAFCDAGSCRGPDERASVARAAHLLAQYEGHTTRFLRGLNGWFCGLLIDRRRREVVLFNDRYGLQRIYWYEAGRALYFASEAKCLLEVLPELRRVDSDGLAEFFACGCVLEGRTLFPGIAQLPGASMWSRKAGESLRRQHFFDPEEWEAQPRLDPRGFERALEETFPKVVRRYLRDLPDLGMSLTGGLDGRMIMAWADLASGALPCYTFTGEYRDCADVRIARQVADICRQPHHTLGVGAAFREEFPALARKAVHVSDGTMDVSGAVELFANRLARRLAPIRLTGNYGSEVVRGNVAFGPASIDTAWLDRAFQPALVQASQRYRQARRCRETTFIAFRQVPWYHHGRFSLEQSQLTPRSPYLDNDLVALMYRVPDALAHSRGPSLAVVAGGNPALARLPTDRGRTLERIPWLGGVRSLLQELTFKAEYAYDYGMPRWLAALDHQLARMRLERLFLGRHKFYHFRVWYRDHFAGFLQQTLLDRRALERPHVDGPGLQRMVTEHVAGTHNHTSALHLALTAELMYRTLVERR